MRHADTLAALRKGHSDEQIKECLEALASRLHCDDPTCVALDAAIRVIEDEQESQRAIAEMRADDLDNARSRYQDRGEYDSQTKGVHGWLSSAVV